MAAGVGLIAGGEPPEERRRLRAEEVRREKLLEERRQRDKLADEADNCFAQHRITDVNAIRSRLAPLVSKIAAEHGTTYEAVMSRTRHPRVVRARHHALAVSRWSTGLSLPELGRAFFRDHTTVMSAIKNWEMILNGELL